MRILHIFVRGAACLMLAVLIYALYWHVVLVRQRHVAEEFLALAKTWKIERTSEADLKKDMARFPRLREWCSEGTCTWVYDFPRTPVIRFKALQFLGIRKSELAFEVAVHKGSLRGLFFKYATEYPDQTFRIFDIGSSPPIYSIPEGRTTWAVQPHVTTVPIGSGSSLIHLYSPFVSNADWARVWTVKTGCISRWIPCREYEEVLPEAWREYVQQPRDP